jgi:hypothetical protein
MKVEKSRTLTKNKKRAKEEIIHDSKGASIEGHSGASTGCNI